MNVQSTAVAAATTPEPLANLQWDMRQIGATATGSYAKSLAVRASGSGSSTPASTAITPTCGRTSTRR